MNSLDNAAQSSFFFITPNNKKHIHNSKVHYFDNKAAVIVSGQIYLHNSVCISICVHIHTVKAAAFSSVSLVRDDTAIYWIKGGIIGLFSGGWRNS